MAPQQTAAGNSSPLPCPGITHRRGGISHLTKKKIGHLASCGIPQIADASGEFLVYNRFIRCGTLVVLRRGGGRCHLQVESRGPGARASRGLLCRQHRPGLGTGCCAGWPCYSYPWVGAWCALACHRPALLAGVDRQQPQSTLTQRLGARNGSPGGPGVDCPEIVAEPGEPSNPSIG
jgi:hypothetical protein